MKKTFCAAVAMIVLVSAGAASAYPGGRFHGGHRSGGEDYRGRGGLCGAQFNGRTGQGRMMHGNGFGGYGACPYADSVEMPQEIREKITEARKTEIDMRALLVQRPVDKAKAQALHTKLAELRREISEWYFNNELDYMEKPVR